MATEFVLPELGENVEKGDIVRVLVSVGDNIKIDQAVLELETDKATVDVPSSVAGKVSEIRVKAGDKVSVGQVVLVVDSAAPEAAAPKAAPAAKPAAEAAAPESSKPEPPKSEPPKPEPSKPAARPAPVVDIAAGRPAAAAKVEPAAAAVGTGSALLAEAPVPVAAAPSVRRYARELGVEIDRVTGSGPGGRIGSDDVKEHVKTRLSTGGRRAAGPEAGSLPDFTKWGEVEVRPMSSIRRKTAEHLSIAWQAPHVTQHDRADVTALEEFRASFGPRVEKGGGKLTVTAIAIKVCAMAIARFPQFASSVDMAAETIIFKKYCHIGVAVDTPNGLLVPVIRDADVKTITEIANDLASLSQKARDRKITLEEMAGSVFSVTNLGGIGGTAFTPIINQPEVAILGLSRTSTEAVYKDGQFVPRLMLPLSLSYDHRVIDGADAARFLRFVAEGLEQPWSLML
jgi:pyruvate dehydrogenase E2 component (dihydrolipoyllysine-residue acetyltransferase)